MPKRSYGVMSAGYGGAHRRPRIGPLLPDGNFHRIRSAKRVRVGRAPPATRGFWGPQNRSAEEQKVVDTASANYALDTTGSVTLINGVATGTDYTNRIGRKVVWKSVQIRGLWVPADATVSNNLCRICLVWDSQPNGALPTIADIFQQALGNSMLNLNNRDRFKMIMDKQFIAAEYSAVGQAVPGTGHIKAFRKLTGLETIFDGTTAAIGDIQSGALLLVTLGTQPTASSHVLTAALRCRFVDA